MLLALVLMFVSPLVLVYLFAARAQARAARAGEDSGPIGLAIRIWAYQQVLPPVALLAMFFWVTLFVMVSGGGSSPVTAPPPPATTAPPAGYEWGPNDSLRRIVRAAPTRRRTPPGIINQKAKEAASDLVSEDAGARASRWSEAYPALPPDDRWPNAYPALPPR